MSEQEMLKVLRKIMADFGQKDEAAKCDDATKNFRERLEAIVDAHQAQLRTSEVERLAERLFVENHYSWREKYDMNSGECAHDSFVIAERFIKHRDDLRRRKEQGSGE